MLFLEKKIQISGSSLAAGFGLNLSQISVIGVHSVHNTTIRLINKRNFENMSLTIRTLNGNKILKKLGLLTSVCVTDFMVTFDLSPWLWFGFIWLIMPLIVYFGAFRDIFNSKVKKVLFGARLNRVALEDHEGVPAGEIKPRKEDSGGLQYVFEVGESEEFSEEYEDSEAFESDEEGSDGLSSGDDYNDDDELSSQDFILQ